MTVVEERLERMRDKLDRLGRRVGREQHWPHPRQEYVATDVDLLDRGDEFVVRFDLPGFDPEDLSVELLDYTVEVTAERDPEEVALPEGGRYVRQERPTRPVRERVELPGDVDHEGATARYDDGVLAVHVPKAERTEAGVVEIEGGEH